MSNLKITYLTEEEINGVTTLGETQTYHKSTNLFYEGQVPCMSYLLLAGEIRIYRKDREVKIVKRGGFFGHWELLHNKPINSTAKITPFSTVSILYKSTLLNLDQNALLECRSVFSRQETFGHIPFNI